MLTSELTEYLKTIKKMNPPPTDADLHDALKSSGWNEDDIKQAIAFIKQPDTPPAPTPMPKPASIEPARPVPREPLPLSHKEPVSYSSRPALTPQGLPGSVVVNQSLSNITAKPNISMYLGGVSPESVDTLPQQYSAQERPFGTSTVRSPGFASTPSVEPKVNNTNLQSKPRDPHDAFGMKVSPEMNTRPQFPQVRPVSGPTTPIQNTVKQAEIMPHRSFVGMGSIGSLTPNPEQAPPASAPLPKTMKIGEMSSSGTTVMPAELKETPTLGGKTSRSIVKLLVVVILAVLVLGGGGFGAYAYYKGWVTMPELPSFLNFLSKEPKVVAPYTESNFLSSILQKFETMTSATYEMSLAADVRDREAGAKPFSVQVPEANKELALSYKRDQDRFRALSDIHNGLGDYFDLRGSYPENLAKLDIIPKDPKTGKDFEYYQRQAGKDYELVIIFETLDAVAAVKGNGGSIRLPAIGEQVTTTVPRIREKTVTFNSTNSTNYYFSGRPSQPTFASFMESIDKLLNYLPPDLSTKVAFSGASELGKTSSEIAGFNLKGSFGFHTSNFNIDTEAEMVNVGGVKGDYFVRINKLPTSLPFIGGTLTPLLANWIKLDPSSLGDHFLGGNEIPQTSEEYTKAKEKVFLALRDLIKIADEEQVIDFVTEPVLDTSGIKSVYRYNVFLKRESILPFLRKLDERFGSVNEGLGTNPFKLTQETIDLLESPEFEEVFAYLKENNTITVTVDATTGNVVRFEFAYRVVPSDAVLKLAGKQLNIISAIGLQDINKPIAVIAPSPFMTQEDATIKITGETKASYRMKKQIGILQSVERALTDFKTYTGNYPASLEDLTKKGSEFEVQNVIPKGEEYNYQWISSRYKDAVFLSAVPTDAFTGKPLTYVRKGNSYELGYSMELAEYKKGSNPSGFYKSIPGTTVGSKTRYILAYASGTNTATPTERSLEAISTGKLDGDADNVSDSLEAFIGTDPKKKDTDGDGYSDGDEFTRGTNPLGPGNLETDYGSGLFF